MNILDIWGKRTLEHIADALAEFNRGVDDLIVRAISGNASKGLEIAYILNKKFGVEIGGIEMKPSRFDGIETFCIQITLKGSTIETEGPVQDYDLPESGFVDFPVYHLLLDWWLFEKKELQLFQGNTRLVTIGQDGSVTIGQDGAMKHGRKVARVRNALCRCGLLRPSNWKEIAKKLSEFDDVILGLDTNVLSNCTVSEHLLPALSIVNPKGYAPTPNWMLFVIPNGVIHEIEQAANLRDSAGRLKAGGRMGFRALQEVIELNQSIDIPGISLLVVGEANPVLDVRTEIQGLRTEFQELRKELQGLRADLRKSQQESQHSAAGGVLRSGKSSSGDMIIRSQFKAFLRQLDFHKGAYFLTADKSSAALARAEGLCPIYVQPPPRTPRRIRGRRVPVGKLIYEMAVQFRPLTIKQSDKNIVVRCDARGETTDYWVSRSLQIEKEGFEQLQSDYQGKFSLKKVTEIWNRFIEGLMGLEK